MTALRVLVVDDEHLARARLVRMLARIGDTVVVGEASSGQEALTALRTTPTDVVLLDIDMPVVDGFGVAEAAGVPSVIFTTAHAEYAVQAFDADAVDYLLKPIIQERLERALGKVRGRLARATPPPGADLTARLVVNDNGALCFFDPAEVTRLHAEDKYTTFQVNGAEYLLRDSLSQLEARLAGRGFVRVHRKELVRIDAVRALESEPGGAALRLSDGQRVPVSRRFLGAVRDALLRRAQGP